MEKLYNGIILPNEWPPKDAVNENREPMRVPYLESPPETITIDVGRQLFVDNFLIEETTLISRYHQAVKYEGNPVLSAKTPLEKDESLPCACPKSGGVWWDESDEIFKMWYEAGWLHQMAYATSKDGINWNRPDTGLDKGTNQILLYQRPSDQNGRIVEGTDANYFRADSSTVFIDKKCSDKNERYKMFMRNPGGLYPGIVMTSADGINWENSRFTMPTYDRSTIFYNPFRKKWVYSILSLWNGRTRNYREHENFLEGASWSDDEEVRWLCTDNLDNPNPYIGFQPQLYNVDAIAYESIMLGMFQIMYGPDNDVCERYGTPKITELMPMYSRDGFHWSRPSRQSFIPASYADGTWDKGYIQSVGGVCVIVDDELWFYYSAFAGDSTKSNKFWTENGMYSNGATGIAKLRRDGFVSMQAKTGGGHLLTRKIVFNNKNHIFVNVKGELYAEIISDSGKTLATSETINADSTKIMLTWKNNFNMSIISGKPFRIKFYLTSGDLYSFWLSEEITGESDGYLAAGAPQG